MLKINLLPQEYRKSEGTPLGALLVLMLCTLLSVSALTCVAWLYIGILKEAEMNRDMAKEEMDNLAPMARYADSLEGEKKEYEKRSEVIRGIENTRILWTKKLDQLLEVIHNEGDTMTHWVWLDELKINMGGRTGKQAGSMKLKGSAAGDQIKQASQFNRDLREHALFTEDFEKISNPTGETTEDDKMIPATAISFDWEMVLKDKSQSAAPKRPVPRPKPKPAK